MPTSSPPLASPCRAIARCAGIDAALRPFATGGAPGVPAGPLTAQRVATTAHVAATAILPLLGEPGRSAHRVRALVALTLVCRWAEFEQVYAAALAAICALPPALDGVDEPAWNAGLPRTASRRNPWATEGQWWTPPAVGAQTIAPGGTAGRLARHQRGVALVTTDGRPLRLTMTCRCETVLRRAHAEVAFEQVHFRSDGSILDVTVGAACRACRAPIPGA